MEKPFTLSVLTRTVISQQIWGIFKPEENELSLSLHRQRAAKKISRLKLPTLLSFFLEQGLILLEQAYNEAFDWLIIYVKDIKSLKYKELDVVCDEKYCFSKFMTPMGEFNDLNWVKQFVDDQQFSSRDRFRFACFYCFEEKVQPLWQLTLENGWYRNKDYSSIRHYEPGLVSFWAHYLDGKQSELLSNVTPANCFYYGFKIAIRDGHEKAVHYFWDKLSRQQRTSLLNDIDAFAQIICETVYHKYPKILHFLYSQLDLAQQQSVLRYDLQQSRYPSIWGCYLQPSLVSFIPEQITLHQTSLPTTAYSEMLYQLASKIKEIGNPIYQQVFHTIWKLGSTENKNDFLEFDLHLLQYTLSKLLSAKQFNFIRWLLKGVSFQQKKNCLFQTEEGSLIYDPSYRSDPAAIRNYLLVFLTDVDEGNTTPNVIPFCADSLKLLKEFREKSYFAKHYLKDTAKENTQFFLSILKNVSLEIEINDLLKDLLQKTEENLVYNTF